MTERRRPRRRSPRDAVPDEVVARLRAAREVLAVGHENPDADTLGATLARVPRSSRRSAGARPRCSPTPPPPLYAFMPGVERVRPDPDPAVAYDLLVLSDCATAERVGAVAGRHPELFRDLPRVIIDHHASNDARGPARLGRPRCRRDVRDDRAARGRGSGVPLDAGDGALATALMAGIVMDTATFAHPNATPRTLAVSAALVEAGAPLSDISRRLYRSKPNAQLELFGRVLARIRTSPDGRIIWSTLEPGDLEATGALPAHSEGIIDLLAQSETAEVAMLLKGQDDGTTRCQRAHEARRRRRDRADRGPSAAAATRARPARPIQKPLDEAVVAVGAEAARLAAAVSR